MTLIKCSERALRNPCKKCKRGGQADKGSIDTSIKLYWAHDTERPYGGDCGDCTKRYGHAVNGRYTLIDANGNRHECETSDAPTPAAVPAPKPTSAVAAVTAALNTPPTPAPTPQAPVAAPKPTDTSDPMQAAFAAFMDAIAGRVNASVDAETVRDLIDERLARIGALPARLEIMRPDGTVKPISGTVHPKAATVIKIVAKGRAVMMVGPMGTGKSTIAKQTAEALGLEYAEISLTPDMTRTALLGYMNASGDYVTTKFRERYEHGGVFHLDEIDNSHPSIMAVLNSGLAGECMAFPDGMVKRHPDFRCVASGNTFGTGPDRIFVGRNQMDGATKDRFAIVEIPVDEPLETAMAYATGLEVDKAESVLRYVRYLRLRARELRMAVDFSPRRSSEACDLLTADMEWSDVHEISIRRGMSATDWSKVSSGAPYISI